uniref:Selenoprotein P N-terminal domain-containing protein n=1 Tax=Dicentrarchus labrax TaxID=13489 RepID=A0A8C4GVD2_DICLA
MIVNEREAQSRAMYWELKRRAPPGVPVYQQTPLQNDVWEALDGDKDDFLVYDRCGLLTFHIVLPYSFLHYPYVEAAIRATYHKNICNCSTTAIPTIQLDTDDSGAGDAAPGATHHHHSHPHHHSPHSHQHPHTSHQNQSRHQHDTSQNETLHLPHLSHHHHHPRHQHHGLEVDNTDDS